MVDVHVLVDEERVPAFYAMVGEWLAKAPTETEPPASDLPAWSSSAEDLALAALVWQKLSPPAQALFSILLEKPGHHVPAEELAQRLDIEKGKYGIAGMLAWPGRHCIAVGRRLPVEFESGALGEGADYWISAEAAPAFLAASTATA
jgi:hypothetical protein